MNRDGASISYLRRNGGPEYINRYLTQAGYLMSVSFWKGDLGF